MCPDYETQMNFLEQHKGFLLKRQVRFINIYRPHLYAIPIIQMGLIPYSTSTSHHSIDRLL